MRVKQLSILSAVILASSLAYSDTSSIVGRASVIDGDTIDVHGERIRINGIDAPETRQECSDADGNIYRCGRVSAGALDEFLAASRPVTCSLMGRDRYRRWVGRCARADGVDIARWMVRSGHAFDWPRYSKGLYAKDELAAKKAKAGVWAGQFALPWDWRKN